MSTAEAAVRTASLVWKEVCSWHLDLSDILVTLPLQEVVLLEQLLFMMLELSHAAGFSLLGAGTARCRSETQVLKATSLARLVHCEVLDCRRTEEQQIELVESNLHFGDVYSNNMRARDQHAI